jgi:tetratricopeptide (TPR) repeat protein
VPVEENERIGRRLIELAEREGDRLAAGYARARLVRVLFDLGRNDEAAAMAEAAIAQLDPLGDSVDLADALRSQGWLRWRNGDGAGAEPVLRRAIEVASRVDALAVLADATMDLGVALSIMGRRDECIDVMEDAYRLAKESGDFNVLMRLYINYPATGLNWASDFPRILRVTSEGVELARKAGDVQNVAWLLGNLVDTMVQQMGPNEEVLDMAREAVDLADRIGDAPLVGMRLSGLGIILTIGGELEEATDVFERAAEILDSHPDPQFASMLSYGRGLSAVQRDDLPEAVAHLTAGVEVVRTFHADALPEGVPQLVRSLLALGQRETALTYDDLVEQARSPFGVALGRVVEGLLDTDPARAVAVLTDATERLEALGVVTELGWAQLDLATASAAAGLDPAGALEAARDTFTKARAAGFLTQVESVERTLAPS